MSKEQRGSNPGVRIGRLVVAGAALGALSASALALTPAGARPKPPAPFKVSTMSTSSGTVLSSKGLALYTLQASSTPCTSACWAIWPRPLLSRGQQVSAGPGVQASQLGTRAVSGGTQVTYKGKLVYWFFQDSPGQIGGNISDTWGKWTAVVVKPAASNSNSGSGGSGGSNSGSGGASF